MKKKYMQITAAIITIVFSICTLVFADNNLIDNNLILDSNNIIDNEIINNTLVEETNQEDEMEELNGDESFIQDLEIQNNTNTSSKIETKSSKVIEDGTYRIAMFSNPSIGVDIEAGSKDNEANVLLWDWYEENNVQKQFELEYGNDGYYIIRNKNSNKVLDVQNAGMTNGSNVWQYEENGSDAQKWIIQKNSNGSYSIISKLNGLYLDIQNGNIANGGNVQVYE